jgi:hypothetical protein
LWSAAAVVPRPRSRSWSTATLTLRGLWSPVTPSWALRWSRSAAARVGSRPRFAAVVVRHRSSPWSAGWLRTAGCATHRCPICSFTGRPRCITCNGCLSGAIGTFTRRIWSARPDGWGSAACALCWSARVYDGSGLHAVTHGCQVFCIGGAAIVLFFWWTLFVAIPNCYLYVDLLLFARQYFNAVGLAIRRYCSGIPLWHMDPLHACFDVLCAVAITHHNIGARFAPTRYGCGSTPLVQSHFAGNDCIDSEVLYADHRSGSECRYGHRRRIRPGHVNRTLGRYRQFDNWHSVRRPLPGRATQVVQLRTRNVVVRLPEHNPTTPASTVFEVRRIRRCVCLRLGQS